jgi:uncharacterized protein
MAGLSPEAKALISEIHPGLVATADRSGRPNVSAKGTFRVLDNDRVLFADVNSPRTIANLLENPQASVIVFDAATRRGCRVWGQAEVLTSGEVFDGVNEALAASKMQAKHVVVLSVDECLTF